ncbi:S-layer protein [Candidatus Woesearchaeota archaeon]|nr:S-layer protein [Candidatus Woesearchaeota archaeon]
MRVRKAIKKIAALGAGISMVGATMLGAMAADLSNYPDLFIKDGQFNGVLVVGDKAAAEDVVGSIDIATSLQYALAQPVATPSQPGGQGGLLSVSGDAVPISESSDLLEIRERIGQVKQTLTEFDLAGLQGGTIITDEGSTDYNQYLRFEDSKNTSNANWIASGKAGFEEDEDDIVGDYLVFGDGDLLFEYELEFEEGVESEVDFVSGTSGPEELPDLENEEFNVLGKVFSVVDTKIDRTGSRQIVTIDLLGGDVLDTLEEGETRTYTIDGKEYEVTMVIISDNQLSAKFSVNGEITDELKEGDTDVLRDGTEIGVRDIMPNEAEEETGGDIVEFFLGANKVSLKDNNFSDTNFDAGGVKVHEEDIEDARVRITATNATDTLSISSIRYRLYADSPKGNIYVPPGHGLKEYLDEPEGMLSDIWDIRYEGLMDTGVSILRFDANGDDSYDLLFTNREGLEYDVPFLDNSEDTFPRLKYGSDDNDFWFTEGIINSTTVGVGNTQSEFMNVTQINNVTETAAQLGNSTNTSVAGWDACGNFWPIDEKDYFLMTDQGGSAFTGGDETSFSHVLTYESIDTGNSRLTFNDEGTGQREIIYGASPNYVSGINTTSGCALGYSRNLVVGGTRFDVYVSQATNGTGSTTATKYPVIVDLNGDALLNGHEILLVINGGGLVDLGVQNPRYNMSESSDVNSGEPAGTTFHALSGTASVTISQNFTVSLTTLASEFDGNGILDTGQSEMLTVFFYGRPNQRVDLNVPNSQKINDTSQAVSDQFPTNITQLSMHSLDEEDLKQGLSAYGAFFEQTDKSDSDDADDLTVEYPLQQRGADVFVTIGSTKATRVGPSAGGAVVVNQISVGHAKLASEVAGRETTQNLIAVGGPCINSVAATLMGSSAPLCGEASGLKAGQAVIKLFENGDNVAMLVAGWSAADTRRATKVVAEYKDYADKLVGSEVVVSGTSGSDITVSAPATKSAAPAGANA